MKRNDILLDSVKLIEIENFLSIEECELLVNSANYHGFSSLEKEYPEDYRSNKRLVSYANLTSKILWKRLQKMLNGKDFNGISPFGYGYEGIWKPIGLNTCFKFSVYEEGDFFKPHFDGIFIPVENQSTIVTMMIYLNDNFEKGESVFYSEKNDKEVQIKPFIGKAVLFNHDIPHEGKPIKKGFKYILRTGEFKI